MIATSPSLTSYNPQHANLGRLGPSAVVPAGGAQSDTALPGTGAIPSPDISADNPVALSPTEDTIAAALTNGGLAGALAAATPQTGPASAAAVQAQQTALRLAREKQVVPEEAEDEKKEDDIPWLPVGAAAGALAIAGHLWHHRHHFLKRIFKALKLFVKKTALRIEKLREKLKQKRLAKKEERAKKEAEEAQRDHDLKKKAAEEAKKKGTRPGATEAEQRASRDADLELERAAKRTAVADTVHEDAKAASLASRVRLADIEDELKLAKAAGRRNIVGFFAIPIAASVGVVVFRKPGESVVQALGKVPRTFWNWSVNTLVPDNVQKAFKKKGIEAGFGQLGSDIGNAAEHAGAFIELVRTNPHAAEQKAMDVAKAGMRGAVKAVDWFEKTNDAQLQTYFETGGEVSAQAANDPNITSAVQNALVAGGTSDTARQALLAVVENPKIRKNLTSLKLSDPPAPAETPAKKPPDPGAGPRDHIINAQHAPETHPGAG